MTDPNSSLQQYALEVRETAAQIIQQLPQDINTQALQIQIAEAIAAHSEARILAAIQEGLAYRPASASKPSTIHVKVGDINVKVDNSRIINYWADNSRHYTDSSERSYWVDNSRTEGNYWADNRHCEDKSYHSSQSTNAILGFDLIGAAALGLFALLVALAVAQPCGQQPESLPSLSQPEAIL